MNERVSALVNILVACTPILVALVGIIPTIISNRKKTQESIDALKVEIKENNNSLLNDVKKSNDALRAELRADSAETNAKVDQIDQKLASHIREDENDKAKTARYRILRFYDETCEGREHSESHFEDIIDDIDWYEKYCGEHKDFKNNRGQAACKYLVSLFIKIKAKGGFLTHKTGDEP